MAAAVVDLYIEQGATFTRTLTLTGPASAYTPVDLTGYTARGMIKSTAQDTSAVASFTCTIDDPTTGKITLLLDAETTASISALGNRYSSYTKYTYDVEIESADGLVYRILNGKISVSPEVTK